MQLIIFGRVFVFLVFLWVNNCNTLHGALTLLFFNLEAFIKRIGKYDNNINGSAPRGLEHAAWSLTAVG